ncbi:UbiA family prenyltransferase [Ancylobacter mangrovi]|uniref:UbiA family prenyltransferase n=1 Tax=Ancylobacter mangrovi TaxID=2972472 RepID=UPI002163467F|nr:UbiA family prenyltransferase [Ancylobacter mangrovi]MCS0502152.1 UbiA family prenyltransferase [Ancylobacter mangrovi]
MLSKGSLQIEVPAALTKAMGQGEPVIGPPLVVDLDGTLLRSDLLVESAFAHVGARPSRLPVLLRALLRGKAALKAAIARETPVDETSLPYDERVLELIHDARAQGREVYIASASNERYVAAVAGHVGADGWFASSDSENLSSHAKTRRLVEAFGEGGFDYVGDDRADLPVWAAARECIAVHPSAGVRRALTGINADARFIEPRTHRGRAWLKLLRVHQWAKNALVFVPMVTSHNFDLGSVVASVAAFFAFSFAASAIYILNDLVDIDADRKHPSKRRRPLAAGTVPILTSIPVAAGLMGTGIAVALAIGPLFAATLLTYLALTTAYTFFLKRKLLVDIVTLAALYTIRIIGGAVAIDVPVSEWLLGFSLFIFTSLALIKRYVEMAARLDASLPDPNNRNYRKADLDIVAALAAATGYNAVTFFAIYISSDHVRAIYAYPQLLWLVCPVLIYWLGRALLMAHRRDLDDDPIVFAIRDRNSHLALLFIGAILLVATGPL